MDPKKQTNFLNNVYFLEHLWGVQKNTKLEEFQLQFLHRKI